MTLNATEPKMRIEDVPEEQLRAAAQGCTEHSCIYHGNTNREIARRGLPR